MDARALLVAAGVVALAELPDKTMLATLYMASRARRRLAVWVGVTLGYWLHVVISVTVGGSISLLPERPVRIVVGVLFLVGAIVVLRAVEDDSSELGEETAGSSALSVARRSFAVIAVAEFADLTQLSTAGLAARSGRPIETGIGAAVALATVAGGATLAGSWLAERVPVRPLRIASAAVFATIGVVTLVGAVL